MKKILKGLRKREEGAVLVLVALMLTVLLGITALAVDFGIAYYQKQKLQGACDSAALAAATVLPDTTQARNLAYEYMGENGFSSSPSDVIVEFEGSPATKVRVTSTYTFDTTFGRILGTDEIDVTCHAAAGSKTITNPGGGEFPYLIFAREGQLTLGSQYFVDGSVHTNGALKTNPGDGSGSFVKQMSYGTTYDMEGHPWMKVDGEYYYAMKQLSTSDTRLYFNSVKSEYMDITWIANTRAAEAQPVETVKEWMNNGTLNEDGNPIKIYPVQVVLEQDATIDERDSIQDLTDKCEEAITRLENTANAYIDSVAVGSSSMWDVTTDTSFVKSNHDLTTRNTILETNEGWYAPGSNAYIHQEAVFAIKKASGSGPAELRGAGDWGSTGAGFSFRDIVFYTDNPTRNDSQWGAFNYTASMSVTANNVFSNDSIKLYAATLGDMVIEGDIYANGDIYLYNVIVNGDIYCTGNLKSENSRINGLFAADGDVYFGGQATSVDNITSDTVNAMSIYSRNGNITTAAADSGALFLAGIMYAPEGNITINANLTFYGNVIGKTVDASSKTIKAYPFSDLVGYEEIEDDVILPIDGTDEESNIVLVE